MKNRILYAVTVEDVVNVAKEIGIKYTPKNIDFIHDKIEDYFGCYWHDAVEYALREQDNRKALKNNK